MQIWNAYITRPCLGFIAIAVTLSGVGCNEARVRVLVQDEEKKAQPEVLVTLVVHDRRGSGLGWGVGRANESTKATNQNGRALLRTRGSDGSGSVVAQKDGYYNTSKSIKVIGRTPLGNWRLENSAMELTLREQRNPIPMYARRVTAHIPVEDEAVGFDLMVADWVAPHGEGEVSDITFAISRGGEEVVEMMGPHNRKRIYYDATLAIEFQGRGAGVQVIPEDKIFPQSAYIWPYEAPFAGYESRFVRRKKRSDEGSESNVDNDLHYFIKVRPIYDDNGVIQTVHYGKIRGDFDFNPLQSGNNQITFTYYLNPEPNSRNLEFDPKQNLFGELPALERVRDP